MSMNGRYKPWWMQKPLWYALFVSLALHTIVVSAPRLSGNNESEQTILQVTLTTEIAQRRDKTEESGVLQTSPRPLRAMTSTDKPHAPQNPKQIAQAPVAKSAQPSRTSPEVSNQTDHGSSIALSHQSTKPSATQRKTAQHNTSQRDTNRPNIIQTGQPDKSALSTNSVKATHFSTNVVDRTLSSKTASTDSEVDVINALQGKFFGSDEKFSDPREQAYFEQLMAHLRQKLPPHPIGMSGQVRLQIKIEYDAVITGVDVITSSEDTRIDEWAKRAALTISPVPAVPSHLPQPYYFRPTLQLNK